jgi:hypothetical protein
MRVGKNAVWMFLGRNISGGGKGSAKNFREARMDIPLFRSCALCLT